MAGSQLKYALAALIIFALFLGARTELEDVRKLGTQNAYYTGELAEVSRLERELLIFINKSSQFVQGSADAKRQDVLLAFDILWSRVNTQYSKKFIKHIDALKSFEVTLHGLAATLRGIDDTVQNLTAGDAAGLSRISSALHPYMAPVSDLTAKSFAELQRRSLQQTQLQRSAMQGFNRVQWIFLLFTMGTLAFLFHQLRRGEVLLRELRVREQEIRTLAARDHLTGLGNRRQFDSYLAAVDADSHGNTFTLLIIDLDGFKSVNDTQGHGSGDIVLQHVANRLQHIAGEGRKLARLGGDEFALLMNGPPESAVTLANEIIDAVRKPILADGVTVNLGACVGIASRPGGPSAAKQLMHEADTALYRAKADGGNRFTFYSEGLTDRVIECLAAPARSDAAPKLVRRTGSGR